MSRPFVICALSAALLAGCPNKPDGGAPAPKPTAAVDDTTAETPAEAPPQEPERPARPGKPEVPAPDDVAAAPDDAEKLDSGIAYKVLEPATGLDAPRPFDEVEVEYVIWSTDGKMFDRSHEGRPQKVFVHQLMPGFADLLTEMQVGEKRRAWIPGELSFKGARGFPEGPVTLETKLVGLRRVPEPPEAPEDVAAIPPGAQTTASGLGHKQLEKGDGDYHPTPQDSVEVHYTGWTTDGRMFDSSVVRGEPAQFGVGKVIPGWSEGVQLMVEGETRRFWIPEDLAYRGAPGAPQGMLVFDVTLLSVDRAPAPPQTPKDVAAPPAKAKKTDSGLASVVLKKGTGDAHPGPKANVEVHYSGWTTDGKMFDSSVTRGKPLSFRLDRVIPGWTEGVQLMVEGERRRLWIPEELAYKGRPGAPQGMLVFDVELLKILD